MLLMKNQTVHLREDVKFDFNDDVKQCNLDLQRDYLKIIKDATSGNYDALNKLIDNTFKTDIKALEKTLKNGADIASADKKKLFFDEQTGEIISNFTDYIKIIYMERILFDFLSIGLNDLTNNSIKEILESKSKNRIDSFIASMKNDEVIIPRLSNGFETDYAERVQDKKNFLRYVIYFHYLKKSLSDIQKEMEQLDLYRDTEKKILGNGKLINEKESELNNLTTEIGQICKRIEARQKALSNPFFLQRNTYESEQKIDRKKFEEERKEKNELDKELIWLKHVHFVSEKYSNELKSAQKILEDIQKNWENAFHQFIYLHMLENPDQITKLRESYGLSMWDFMDFLLKHKEHQNFNRALYEIDKTKDSQDFEGEEDKKRTEILQNVKDSINSLGENQRKLVNDLFENRYHLKNLWMRKAFWILFVEISLFVIITMWPILTIIIPDVLMGSVTLIALIIGVLSVIGVLLSGGTAANALGDFLKILFVDSWKNMPWLTFRSIPIVSYYCSAFFVVSIMITLTFLIGSMVFYIYKKRQFNLMLGIPNLHQQQIEKSPLEKHLEELDLEQYVGRSENVQRPENKGKEVHQI